MKYKIYKLIHKGKVVYIGKTTKTLEERMRFRYRNNPEVHAIHKECSIELIEETDDGGREKYWINYYGYDNLLNIQKGDTGLDKEEYISKWRKERGREYYKEWHENNKDKHSEKMKRYYQKNKDKWKK